MSEELEIKYDPKRIKELWKKYRITILILLLIPIFLAGYFRAYTYDLPITKDWAEQSVQQSIESQIGNNILQQYPDIDQNSFNNLVNQQVSLYFKENQEQIKQQTDIFREQIKANFQDESGQTYLLAIDPYHSYRQAKNVLENGHVGDEIRDGKPLDNHMIAPNGRTVKNSFHPFAGATIHWISTIFGNDSLMKSMFILPMIFSMLSTIPAFFITRKVAGNMGGFVAATLLAISPVFLGRTPAGFSDTDVYNIFFPLTIAWLFLESFSLRYTQKKKKIILASLAGLATGIFAFAWTGWWYIFDFIIGTLAVYLIFLAVKYRKEFTKNLKTKNAIATGIPYIIFSLLFVGLFIGFKAVLNVIRGPLAVVFIKEAAKASLWPNVYTTVAELGDTTLANVISTLGGNLLLGLGIIGIALFFFKKNKKQYDIKYGIFLIIWLVGTLYGATKGLRFSMFVVPVYSIALGIFAGKTYDYLSNRLGPSLEINKNFIKIVLTLFVIILLISPLRAADLTAKNEVPSMNDAWYTTLTKIKEETPKDAIINSWWDFGHWFKAIADRAVTFDGASQNNPQAHWVGKVLLTANEKEAIAILRMLDCGANDAYNLLLEEIEDPLTTKKVLDEVILLDQTSARTTLAQYTKNPDEIMEKIFCDPPENYFITSEDMVSKAGVWAHFGSWDFERAFIYNTVKSNTQEDTITILKEELGYSEEDAKSIYRQLKGLEENEANNWISPYPGYAQSGTCQTQDEMIICTNGVRIDPKENRAYISTEEGEIPIKQYKDDTQTYINEGTDDISLAYIPEKSMAILMNPPLLNSMFTELFYYEGKNLNNFELFDHIQGFNGFDIYTWKVKWNSQ